VVATLPPDSLDPEIDDLIALPLPESGLDMFASIRIGLQRLAGEAVWTRVAVLPVDHPLVTPTAVVTIASADAGAAIPCHRGKHGHPVVIGRSTAESIVDGCLSGPTLREVLRVVGAKNVDVDDPGVVANCNTPDALQRGLHATR
jgi:CTP:molybdopterin cytidylyltransferase MocA